MSDSFYGDLRDDREGQEALCQYILRNAFSVEACRLSWPTRPWTRADSP
jgi:hypothetical protein